MGKKFLALTGSIIVFASCSSSNPGQDKSRLQVDSSVNVLTRAKQAAIKAESDSIIMAVAAAKAAELEQENNGKKPAGRPANTVASPPPAPPPPPTPSTVSGNATKLNPDTSANRNAPENVK